MQLQISWQFGHFGHQNSNYALPSNGIDIVALDLYPNSASFDVFEVKFKQKDYFFN